MTAQERLTGARQIFLDSAPVIYFVEANPQFVGAIASIFDRLDDGTLQGVTTAVTLAECLIHPIRRKDQSLAEVFVNLLCDGEGMTLVPLDAQCGNEAAQLRARYNFTLTDALQLAAAKIAGCDAFLTNDSVLKRVEGLEVILVEDLLQKEKPK